MSRRIATTPARRVVCALSCGAALTATALPPAAGQAAPGLVAHVTGVRSDRGVVACLLFASAQGFPVNPSLAVGRISVHPRSGVADCAIADVRPGAYALCAYHDENANGRFDQNFLGIPIEGAGCSNGARGHFGPPRFADARFVFAGGATPIAIAMHY